MFESTCGNAVDHENDDDDDYFEQPLLWAQSREIVVIRRKWKKAQNLDRAHLASIDGVLGPALGVGEDVDVDGEKTRTWSVAVSACCTEASYSCRWTRLWKRCFGRRKTEGKSCKNGINKIIKKIEKKSASCSEASHSCRWSMLRKRCFFRRKTGKKVARIWPWKKMVYNQKKEMRPSLFQPNVRPKSKI